MSEYVTGIILAGGKSSRMGRDKVILPWGDSKLIDHVIDMVGNVTDEVIVAAGDTKCFQDTNIKVVKDVIPGAHALGGLYTGLRMATHTRCFVCACDMPFLNMNLIRFLIQQSEGVDLVIPKTEQGLQPIHAVYNKSALAVIEDQLYRQQWDLHALVPKLRTKIVGSDVIDRWDPQGLSFFNLNYPKEYAQACEIQQSMSHVIELV